MPRGRQPKCVDPTGGNQVVWVMQGKTEHMAYLLEEHENGYKRIRWASTSALAWIEPDVVVRKDIGGRSSRRRGAPAAFVPAEVPRSNRPRKEKEGAKPKVYKEYSESEEAELELELPIASLKASSSKDTDVASTKKDKKPKKEKREKDKKAKKEKKEKKDRKEKDRKEKDKKVSAKPDDDEEEFDMALAIGSSSKPRDDKFKKDKSRKDKEKPKKKKEYDADRPAKRKRKLATYSDSSDFYISETEDEMWDMTPSRRKKRARTSRINFEDDAAIDDLLDEAERELAEEDERKPAAVKKKKKHKDSFAKPPPTAIEDKGTSDRATEVATKPAGVVLLRDYTKGTRVAKKLKGVGWISGKIKSATDNYCTISWKETGSQDFLPKAAMAQLVYDADTTVYPIKTKVKKRLKSGIIKKGKVTSLDNSLYHITYTDGTTETVGTSAMDQVVAPKRKKIELEAAGVPVENATAMAKDEIKQSAGQSTEPEAMKAALKSLADDGGEEPQSIKRVEVEEFAENSSATAPDANLVEKKPDPSPHGPAKKMEVAATETEELRTEFCSGDPKNIGYSSMAVDDEYSNNNEDTLSIKNVGPTSRHPPSDPPALAASAEKPLIGSTSQKKRTPSSNEESLQEPMEAETRETATRMDATAINKAGKDAETPSKSQVASPDAAAALEDATDSNKQTSETSSPTDNIDNIMGNKKAAVEEKSSKTAIGAPGMPIDAEKRPETEEKSSSVSDDLAMTAGSTELLPENSKDTEGNKGESQATPDGEGTSNMRDASSRNRPAESGNKECIPEVASDMKDVSSRNVPAESMTTSGNHANAAEPTQSSVLEAATEQAADNKECVPVEIEKNEKLPSEKLVPEVEDNKFQLKLVDYELKSKMAASQEEAKSEMPEDSMAEKQKSLLVSEATNEVKTSDESLSHSGNSGKLQTKPLGNEKVGNDNTEVSKPTASGSSTTNSASAASEEEPASRDSTSAISKAINNILDKNNSGSEETKGSESITSDLTCNGSVDCSKSDKPASPGSTSATSKPTNVVLDNKGSEKEDTQVPDPSKSTTSDGTSAVVADSTATSNFDSKEDATPSTSSNDNNPGLSNSTAAKSSPMSSKQSLHLKEDKATTEASCNSQNDNSLSQKATTVITGKTSPEIESTTKSSGTEQRMDVAETMSDQHSNATPMQVDAGLEKSLSQGNNLASQDSLAAVGRESDGAEPKPVPPALNGKTCENKPVLQEGEKAQNDVSSEPGQTDSEGGRCEKAIAESEKPPAGSVSAKQPIVKKSMQIVMDDTTKKFQELSVGSADGKCAPSQATETQQETDKYQHASTSLGIDQDLSRPTEEVKTNTQESCTSFGKDQEPFQKSHPSEAGLLVGQGPEPRKVGEKPLHAEAKADCRGAVSTAGSLSISKPLESATPTEESPLKDSKLTVSESKKEASLGPQKKGSDSSPSTDDNKKKKKMANASSQLDESKKKKKPVSKSKRKLPSGVTQPKGKRPRTEGTNLTASTASDAKSKKPKSPGTVMNKKKKSPASPPQDQKAKHGSADPPGFTKIAKSKGSSTKASQANNKQISAEGDFNNNKQSMEKKTKKVGKGEKYSLQYPIPTGLNALNMSKNAVEGENERSNNGKLDGRKMSSGPPRDISIESALEKARSATATVPPTAPKRLAAKRPAPTSKEDTGKIARASSGKKERAAPGSVPAPKNNTMEMQGTPSLSMTAQQGMNGTMGAFGFVAPHPPPSGGLQGHNRMQWGQVNNSSSSDRGGGNSGGRFDDSTSGTRPAGATAPNGFTSQEQLVLAHLQNIAARGDPSLYFTLSQPAASVGGGFSNQGMLPMNPPVQFMGAGAAGGGLTPAQLVAAMHLGILPPQQQQTAQPAHPTAVVNNTAADPASLAAYFAQNQPRRSSRDPPGASAASRRR